MMAPSSLPPFPQSHAAAAVVGIVFALLRFCNSSNVDKGDRFRECSRQFDCGLIRNLTYPFWGGNRPRFCGSVDFQLECRGNDYPVMNISGREFSVLHVNQSAGGRSITIRWLDWNRSWCPTERDFPQFYFPSLTRATTVNMTVLYNCSRPDPSLLRNFTCQQNGRERQGMFMRVEGGERREAWDCGEVELIPVKRVALGGDRDLREILSQGFEVNYLSFDLYCGQCESSGGRCGSNTSTTPELFECHCLHGTHQISCNGDQGSKLLLGSRIRRKVVTAASVGAVGVIFSITLIVLLMKNRLYVRTCINQEKQMSEQNGRAFIVNHGSLAPKRYNYSDIRKMTRSFQNRVGKGGYGTVYKGRLLNGSVVAVKVLNETKGNGEEFINEVASIARTSHVNIVSLVGFCYRGKKRALVYEFMPNGSLDSFISSKGVLSKRIGWGRKYEIALGIARGLEYLHRGCNTRILHFDIKPQNILLDKDLCPKISDFGLAKLCKRGESIISMTGARGTIGYIAPEVFYRGYGGVSHKSDVYSYGMLVLEMVGGRAKKIDETNTASNASEAFFPDWIYKDLERGDIGVPYEDMTEEEEDKLRKMVLVSLWCIQIIPFDRPSMSRVIEMLEGSVDSLQVPPKPLLFSPIMQALDSSAESTVQEISQYQNA